MSSGKYNGNDGVLVLIQKVLWTLISKFDSKGCADLSNQDGTVPRLRESLSTDIEPSGNRQLTYKDSGLTGMMVYIYFHLINWWLQM